MIFDIFHYNKMHLKSVYKYLKQKTDNNILIIKNWLVTNIS